jgi:hypothetical protein
MPPQAVATLDDVAAMLGFYDPLPKGAAAHLAGPLTVWRTDPNQPTIERVAEIEALALKQRCLIAFGGAQPGHMVGTAEIVCAMGNLHKEFEMPRPYYEVFTWASVDVLTRLTGEAPSEVRKVRKWPVITDDDVLKPGGRLHPTYQEVATNIRRTAISAMENAPDNPRQYLRPLAEHFIRSHTRVLADARADGEPEIVDRIEHAISTIRAMFPDLTVDQDQAEGTRAR